MKRRYIKLSRLHEDTPYYWGTFCIDNSEIFALMSAVWEFGRIKQNYHAELIEEDEDETDADN